MLLRPHIFICAVASGLLLTGAFPKWGLDPLAWLALVPFALALRTLNPPQSFRFGALCGLVHFLSLLYWLVPTMRIYGNLPAALSIAILFFFCGFLGLFFGAAGWALSKLGKKPFHALLWFPVIWVAVEYTRAFIFTGFPWGFLGHSQYERLYLIQLADLTGVYGISMLIAGVNVALALVILAAGSRHWQGTAVSWRLAGTSALAAGLAVGAVLFYGHQRLGQIDRAQATAATVRIAAVQGNIAQSDKWDEAHKEKTIEIYNRLSAGTLDRRPDLVVWPETAAPFYFMVEEKPTRQVLSGIRRADTGFLLGSPSVLKRGEDYEFYNSAWLLDRRGRLQARYDKSHLVPFGEYTPFQKWLPFLGKIVEQVGDFIPGPKGRVIDWSGRRLGVQICYEIIFPYLARAQVRNGADLLINITNDAWYGRTSGPYQHFSMVAFRSVENRRALVRAANTGVSGFVDPGGRIGRKTELFTETAVVDTLPLMKIRTIYTRFGDVFAKACLMAALAAIIGSSLLSRKKTVRQRSGRSPR